jgi:hypothetical protein
MMPTNAELERDLRATQEKVALLEQTITSHGDVNRRLTVLESTVQPSLDRIEKAVQSIGCGDTPHDKEESARVTAAEIAIMEVKAQHKNDTIHFEGEIEKLWKEKASVATYKIYAWTFGVGFAAIASLLTAILIHVL